jgi:hypothetical protein
MATKSVINHVICVAFFLIKNRGIVNSKMEQTIFVGNDMNEKSFCNIYTMQLIIEINLILLFFDAKS